MATLDAIGWCDSNMQRVYPFADDATCMSASPGKILPPSFLVDMQLVVPAITSSLGAAEAQFFISTITRNADGFTLNLSYRTSANASVVCATSETIPATIVNSMPLESRTFQLIPTGNSPGGINELNSLSGRFIVGSCLDMSDIGVLTFDWTATKLIDVRVYMYNAGLNSMTFVNGSNSNVMYNDVVIEAGDGIDFSVDGNTVLVSRVPTQSETADGITSVEDILARVYQELGSPIRLINGLGPDENGNFIIDGGDCVNVETNQNHVIISNSCSKPCCDDTSISDVSTSLSLLEEAQKRLEAYYEALTININAMQARLSSLIASRK